MCLVSTSSAAVAANPQPGSWRHAMRRAISDWFPTFPIDRLQRIGAGPPDGGPFVTSMHDGRRRVDRRRSRGVGNRHQQGLACRSQTRRP
jgi:hypothetical protein